MDNDIVNAKVNDRIAYFMNIIILLDNVHDKEKEQDIEEAKENTERMLLEQLQLKYKY